MQAISIIIGIIVIFVGGVFVTLNKDDIITSQQINKVEFEESSVVFTKQNVELVTSTDEFGNTIKVGIRVPITYNFPVATTTGFVVEEVNDYVEMNLGSYEQCRRTKTKQKCVKEFKQDIKSNIETYQINKKRELEELKSQDFRDEININDL